MSTSPTTATLQAALDALAQMGCKPSRSGDQFIAYCPIHEADGHGHKPSLTLREGDKQAVLVNCHAGCDSLAILKALGVNGTPHQTAGIAATYRYQDAAGKEIREKLRFEPKDFRIRHRDAATGEWVYKAGSGPAVLYRLPELKTAIAEGRTVFVVEGEKDADRLAALGLVATTNIEGAAQPKQRPKWKAAYTDQLKGAARVVLLPDNDAPGRAHMSHIAKALWDQGIDARIIELHGLPEKGDVSDWLKAGHTAEELERLAKDAPPTLVQSIVAPPDPLRRDPIPAEPYPVEALGPILGPALEVIQRTIQAPVPLIAQSLLGAAALAAQPHANIVTDGRVTPLSLFLLTIGASGERKTGVDNLVLKPVQARQRELVDSHKTAMSDHKTALRVWEQAEAAAIKEKVVDLGKVRQRRKEKEEALKALGDEPPEPPLLPNLLVGDPTSEGLFKLFANGQPSLGLFSDEGALFVGGHALARDARLRTIGALSKLWDGRPLDRVRGGDGASILYDRRLSLHLMMQPLVAAELLADPIYQDQGFLARVLLSWPETTAGKRPYVDNDPYHEAAIGRYWKALTDLLYYPPALREGTRNELTPRALRLSPDAKVEWIAYFNTIEKAQAEGGPLEPIRAFASKAAEHAARLAGVLALVDNLHANRIDLHHIQRAILLMEYYVTEALRIHDSGIADPQLQTAQRLLDWLHGLKESHIYLVKVYQHGPSGIRDAKTAKPLLNILVKHRWLAKIDDGMVIDGKFRKEAWCILGKESAT